MRGRSFGERGASVIVAGRTCSDLRYIVNHSEVVCNVMGGAGVGHAVSVTTAAGSGDSVNVFSYLAPSVHNASSSGTGGGRVTIWGAELGVDAARVRVWMRKEAVDLACDDVRVVVNHGAVSCVIGEGSGAGWQVKVNVSGQVCAPGAGGADSFSWLAVSALILSIS